MNDTSELGLIPQLSMKRRFATYCRGEREPLSSVISCLKRPNATFGRNGHALGCPRSGIAAARQLAIASSAPSRIKDVRADLVLIATPRLTYYSLEQEMVAIRLNVHAVVTLTHAVLGAMVQGRKGRHHQRGFGRRFSAFSPLCRVCGQQGIRALL